MVDMSQTTAPLAQLRGITKRFSHVLANDRVNLDLHPGEVHALLGENGAGKSTLMKILYGFYHSDAGEVAIKGEAVQIRSPHDARRLGIGMVFQSFTLIPSLTVVENVALFLPDLPAVANKGAVARRIEEASETHRLKVNPWAKVSQLSVGEQQKVELLKLLLARNQILILDEPTKVLAPHEVDGLFAVFASLRQAGYAVVFITHKLREVLACADRITVLRRGRVAGSLPRAEASQEGLVSLMFGETPQPQDVARTPSGAAGDAPLLELRDAKTRAEGLGVALRGVNLKVMPGEIVGVAGVSGNGQKELGDVILGLIRSSHGTKRLFGNEATEWSPSHVRSAGAGFIPEDPLAMAVVPWMTVQENVAIGEPKRYAWQGKLAVNWGRVREEAGAFFSAIGSTNLPHFAPAMSLSGGNLQRLVVARELGRKPRLLVALYPTKGLDVPTAAAVRRALVAVRDAGGGVVFVSEDLDELFEVSDWIAVMFHGEVIACVRPGEVTMREVGHLMTGGTPHADQEAGDHA
jgi:simple sugar transport system ATP-binding protein